MEKHERLTVENATIGYEHRIVCRNLTTEIPANSITMIVGPNACGKSTLLRAVSGLIKPSAGAVKLGGQSVHTLRPRDRAKSMSLLPQTPVAPAGIRVAELVARGRYPHQGLLRTWTAADEVAVAEAMSMTDIADLGGTLVEELSGGQRQRVWIALSLAQQAPIMLLDEPTTYLDISHQIDLLNLCQRLNREFGYTICVVLHDLNHACRWGTHMIVMSEGQIKAEGNPATVMTAALVEDVFGMDAVVVEDPVVGTPMVVPR